MKRRLFAKTFSSKAVLLVLLALQLVLGLQLQAAQAVASPMPSSMHRAPSMPMAASTDGKPAGARASMPASPANTTAQPDCPSHPAAHGTASETHAATNLSGGIERAPPGKHSLLGKHGSMGTHDCCHASACQCHCVYTSGAIALPALADIATSVAIPSLAITQFVAPRIDEFLRPPIA